jgi:DNA-binding NarL/FixJ family response regulator
MDPCRVVVADDHTLVRQSVVKALAQATDVEVVAEADDAPSAIDAIVRHQPDLAVLDIAMPGGNGFTVAEQVRGRAPQVRLLFVSMHDDDASLQQALAVGAHGFVSKSAPVDALLTAVRTVAAGGRYLSDNLSGAALAPSPETPARLTAREREVLDHLAAGLRPGEIGEALSLSVKTVKNHLTAVYAKLGVDTGAQAVAEAYRRGLVTSSF